MNQLKPRSWVEIFTSRPERIMVILLLTSVFVWACYRVELATTWSFTERDIRRAEEVLRGKLIFFGPEATGGGNLPGGLFYYLLAIPLFFGFEGTGIWSIFALGFSVSCAMVFWFLRSHTRSSLPALVGVSVLLFQAMLRYIGTVLNSTLIFVFVTFATIQVLQAYSGDEKRRSRALICAFVAIGLGMQLHLTILFVLIGALVLQLGSNKIGVKALPWKSWAMGGLLLLLTLAPFFAWKVSLALGYHWGQPAPEYIGRGTTAPLSLLNLFSISEGISWRELVPSMFTRSLGMMTGALLCVPLVLWWMPTRSNEDQGTRPNEALKCALVLTVVGAIPALYYLIVMIGARYMATWGVSSAILIGLCFARMTENPKGLRIFNAFGLACIFCEITHGFYKEREWQEILLGLSPHMSGTFVLLMIAVALVAHFVDSRKDLPWKRLVLASTLIAIWTIIPFQYTQRFEAYPGFTILRNYQAKFVATMIWRRTGWDFEEVRKRVFFVVPHMEQGLEVIYRQVTRGAQKPKVTLTDIPSGFIVTGAYPYPAKPDLADFINWMRNENIPRELKEGILDGGIKLFPPVSRYAITLAGYRTEKTDLYPPYFQNIGFPYLEAKAQEDLQGLPDSDGTTQTDSKTVYFHWNECPGRPAYCRTALKAEFERGSQGRTLVVKTEVRGFTLSQSSRWVVPDFTIAWVGTYVRVRCERGDSVQTVADAIGYYRPLEAKILGMHFGNNSFLAPFDRQMVFPCQGRLLDLTVGKKASSITNTERGLELPQSELKFEFQKGAL